MNKNNDDDEERQPTIFEIDEVLGLKVFLMLFGVTAALIDVNAAESKLVLLENFNENYSKCLRLLMKLQLLLVILRFKKFNSFQQDFKQIESLDTSELDLEDEKAMRA
ncbi:hypothetical protein Tco_1544528 [Tanacetum coccineum]